MHGPPLVAWLLVALSAAAAVVCLVRRGAGDEAVTGTGMAVMAVPMSVFDPWPWDAPLFAAVYALAGARAVLLSRRRVPHHLHHAICSAAMVYMAVSMGRDARPQPGHPGHAGHASAGLPLLTGLLLLYFAGYALGTGMHLVAAPAHRPLTPVLISALSALPVPPAQRQARGAAAIPGPSGLPVPVEAPAAGSGGAGGGAVRAGGAVPPRHTPEVAVACRVSMALAMFAMLLAL